MTRGRNAVGYFALGLIVVGIITPRQTGAEQLTGAPLGETFVEMACAAELAGQAGIRKALVDRLLVQEPGNEKAHWLAGHVRDGDAWKAAQEIEHYRADDPLLREYAKRRETSGEDPASRLKLANWCRDHNMPDRERLHLTELVSWHGVDDPAVMTRLSMVKYHGGWVPKADIEELRRLDVERDRLERKWKPLFASWKADLKSGDTTAYERLGERLAGISDTDALPILEEVISVTDEKAALAVIAWLDGMSSQTATESLVRHAVFSEFDSGRMAAAEALKKRAKLNYIPLLIAMMADPLEVEVEYPFGNGGYRRTTTRQPGTDYDLKTIYHQSCYITDSQNHVFRRSGVVLTRMKTGPRLSDYLPPGRYTEEGTAKTHVNERVGDVLSAVAGESFETPSQWRDWWYDLTEYEREGDKPTYEIHGHRHLWSYQKSVIRHSCLAWGTPIATETGSRPVEQILPGDRVLSQNVDTGQLEYKVVLQRTVRRLGQMRKISMGDDSVTVTLGHPFWVVGEGWQMAKELEIGQRVSCLGDSAKITAIEELPEDAAYNLVVDDFATYFAGASRVLLHDNTMPGPTDSLLPGFTVMAH